MLLIHRSLKSINADDDDNYDVITEWFDSIGKDNRGAKEGTRITYIKVLIEFCKFIKMTPYEIIEEAKAEKKKIIDIDDRAIKTYFVRYKRYIIEKNNAPKTLSKKMTALKSFFEVRNIEVPFRQTRIKEKSTLKENKHIPTREDIKEALQFASIRSKAIILLQASSGLASIDARNITIGQVKEGLAEDNIITFDLRRQKTGVDYITFCSPEATAAILAYMEYRNRPPFANTKEKINQYEKRRIHSDDDYLFINNKISDKYLESFDEKYRFISDQDLQHSYRVIDRSCEKQAPKGSFDYIRSHNMRKYFANTIKNCGLDYITIETFMGHKISGSLSFYTEANIEKLKESYIKVLPELMIIEEIETRTLDSYEYSYNQANIKINNLKTNAMMELYPFMYRIIEDSKEILLKYDKIIKLKSINAERFMNQIDEQYDEINTLIDDRKSNEEQLNNKKSEYISLINSINFQFKLNIPVSFDQLTYEYETIEKTKLKEIEDLDKCKYDFKFSNKIKLKNLT